MADIKVKLGEPFLDSGGTVSQSGGEQPKRTLAGATVRQAAAVTRSRLSRPRGSRTQFLQDRGR